MKTKDLLSQSVDVYKYKELNKKNKGYYYSYTTSMTNFFSADCFKLKHKIEYLRQLNMKDESEAKQYKLKNLVACTVSGTFGKYRYALNCTNPTGVISIDIDKDKNPFIDIEKAKLDVMKLPYVFMTMKSCRGEGIFCLVYYDKTKNIKNIFNALKEEFKSIGYVIDDCSDICRLRYASIDNKALIKEDVEMFDKEIEYNRDAYECQEEWIMSKADIKDIVCCVYALVHFFNYTADDYDSWLLDGFRLATIPNKEVGLRLFIMISENSDNFKNYADVEDKFNECWNTTTYKTNILGYYINKIKDNLGQDWRYRLNDLFREKKIRI